jgi:hypothetical protein
MELFILSILHKSVPFRLRKVDTEVIHNVPRQNITIFHSYQMIHLEEILAHYQGKEIRLRDVSRDHSQDIRCIPMSNHHNIRSYQVASEYLIALSYIHSMAHRGYAGLFQRNCPCFFDAAHTQLPIQYQTIAPHLRTHPITVPQADIDN